MNSTFIITFDLVEQKDRIMATGEMTGNLREVKDDDETGICRFVVIPHLITVDQYAAAVRIKLPAVHDRLRRGAVASVRISGRIFIDPPAMPVLKRMPVGTVRHLVARWPADAPAPSSLVPVSKWCTEQRFTADRVFTAILMGRIPAWGIAGQVAVQLNDELMEIVRGTKKLKRSRWTR